MCIRDSMGTADRAIRVIIALVIAGLYAANVISGTLGIVLIVLAVVFVLTSFVSFCPLYTLFGLNTGKKK